jgi:hypothetical protein
MVARWLPGKCPVADVFLRLLMALALHPDIAANRRELKLLDGDEHGGLESGVRLTRVDMPPIS